MKINVKQILLIQLYCINLRLITITDIHANKLLDNCELQHLRGNVYKPQTIYLKLCHFSLLMPPILIFGVVLVITKGGGNGDKHFIHRYVKWSGCHFRYSKFAHNRATVFAFLTCVFVR